MKPTSPALGLWPTSAPCCSNLGRSKADRLLARPLQLHTSSHQSISHQKNGKKKSPWCASYLSRWYYSATIWRTARYTIFSLMWSYGKVISGRNYVSADMEYSSKRSEEDPQAHKSLKPRIKYRWPWFICRVLVSHSQVSKCLITIYTGSPGYYRNTDYLRAWLRPVNFTLLKFKKRY